MNDETKSCCASEGGEKRSCGKVKCFFLGIVILGTLLIAGVLIKAVIHYTTPAALGEDRAAFRAKNLAELRTANAEALNNYGWQDQARGIVRLPIEQAMRLTVDEWKTPSKGRAALLARQAKASAPAPKVAPKPSQFE